MGGAPIDADLETAIGYTFTDRSLLRLSLTHPSFVLQLDPDERSSNQRLEFLGDAVLNLVLAEALYLAMPDQREGALSRDRAILARGSELVAIARRLGLHGHLRLGEGVAINSARGLDSILEDALEAVVGAIYLDSDLPTARRVVLAWYGDWRARLGERQTRHNPKGRLQEILQARMDTDSIRYETVASAGPDHRKQFSVELLINGECVGRGVGSSKKEAQEAAARKALLTLDPDTERP
jgi:ribonuclease III